MKGSSAIFVLTLLAIEFLDEFIFGAREAACPLIRTDLDLIYAQGGVVLLSLPSLVGSLVEPVICISVNACHWEGEVMIRKGEYKGKTGQKVTLIRDNGPETYSTRRPRT